MILHELVLDGDLDEAPRAEFARKPVRATQFVLRGDETDGEGRGTGGGGTTTFGFLTD